MRVLQPRRFGAVNWRGLWTLCQRDLRRSLKEYRYTVFGPVVSNLLFLAVFRLTLGDAGTAAGAPSFPQFLAAGLIIFAVCERAYDTAGGWLVFDKLEGVVADTMMAPLTPAELVIGYACGAAAAGLLAGAAVTVAMMVFVGLPFTLLPAALLFATAGALLHGLIGVVVGLWSERWDHYTAALTFFVIPFAFLSGTFFPITALPGVGQTLVRLNPVYYVIDGFRFGATGQGSSSPILGAAVVGAMILGLGLLARHLFRIGYKIKP